MLPSFVRRLLSSVLFQTLRYHNTLRPFPASRNSRRRDGGSPYGAPHLTHRQGNGSRHGLGARRVRYPHISPRALISARRSSGKPSGHFTNDSASFSRVNESVPRIVTCAAGSSHISVSSPARDHEAPAARTAARKNLSYLNHYPFFPTPQLTGRESSCRPAARRGGPPTRTRPCSRATCRPQPKADAPPSRG